MEKSRIGTLREELREMPSLQRKIVYVSIFLMLMLFLQSILIMPVILIKYGWGYSVG
jgi:hypothetical protein